MVATFRRHSLAGEMLVLQLAIVVVVLLAVAAVSLAQSQATFNRVEGRRVSALAEQLAANPLVRSQLVRPAPGEALELIRGGRVAPEKLITHSVPLADTGAALAAARSREGVKVIVTNA